MYNIDDIDNIDALYSELEFALRIESDLAYADFGAGNYKTGYHGTIYDSQGELDRTTHSTMGSIQFMVCLMAQSARHGIKTFDFRSASGPNEMRSFEGIFDTDEMGLSSKFKALLPVTVTNPDILVIEQFELLPMYRGKDIGKRTIKLLLHHFKQSCGLLMLEVRPYQHTIFYENDARLHPERVKAMAYDEFTDDEELASLKLMAFFTNMGFQVATGVNEKVVYLSTADAVVHPRDFDMG